MGGKGAFSTSHPKMLKINIQLFAQKRTTISLPKKEYGKIVREIDDLYYAKYKDKSTFLHYSGNHVYKVRNGGYNSYEILSKEKL